MTRSRKGHRIRSLRTRHQAEGSRRRQPEDFLEPLTHHVFDRRGRWRGRPIEAKLVPTGSQNVGASRSIERASYNEAEVPGSYGGNEGGFDEFRQ